MNYFWPRAILHIDGDAFFASVIQAAYPHLKGKPVATGKERGVAIAVSYEAQKFGVKRCMTTWEIKKLCPECFIVNSEFKLYHLFSKRMFEIMRTFTPIVEEYSIDEGFADVTDLVLSYKNDYQFTGRIIKEKIEQSLGITVSVGISTTKSLAKIASNYHKPSGLVVISPLEIKKYLERLPTQKIWGIGYNTADKLQSLGISTGLEFISQSETFIRHHLSKPYLEIWRELHGTVAYPIDPMEKIDYQSMSKVQTFSPPTSNQEILWARLIDRVEEAFEKARKYQYNVGRVILFLKTQKFTYDSIELKISEKTSFPYLIKSQLKAGFLKIYQRDVLYRAIGCGLSDFEETTSHQSSLFNEKKSLEEKIKNIYPLYEKGFIDFGSSLFVDHLNNHYDKNHTNTVADKLRIPMLELS